MRRHRSNQCPLTCVEWQATLRVNAACQCNAIRLSGAAKWCDHSSLRPVSTVHLSSLLHPGRLQEESDTFSAYLMPLATI